MAKATSKKEVTIFLVLSGQEAIMIKNMCQNHLDSGKESKPDYEIRIGIYNELNRELHK